MNYELLSRIEKELGLVAEHRGGISDSTLLSDIRSSLVKPDLVSPWHPMTDSVDLKHIGKFLEELGECVAAAARCQIQGIDEAEPTTGKVNRVWLTEEIADVLANANLVIDRFNLARGVIQERVERKTRHLANWHKMA